MICEIYIQASTRNPAVQRVARARWLISSVSANGQKQTRDGIVCLNNATAKQVALIALAEALSRFNKAAVIKIYISDDFVRNMLISNMPQRWEANDWHKIRQNLNLAHEQQWKYVRNFLKGHAVSYAKADEVINNQTLKEMDWRMNHVKG